MSETVQPSPLDHARAHLVIRVQQLIPQSITAQLTGLVAISVLSGVTVFGAIVWFLLDPPARDDSPVFAAVHVTEITRLMRATTSAAEADQLLTTIRRSGLDIRRVALADLVPSTTNLLSSRLALHPLAAMPDIELLTGLRDPASPPSQIVTRLDQSNGLIFNLTINAWSLFVPPTALVLLIMALFVLLLSIYAVRWITAPLADIADAAASFGRSPHTHAALDLRGPREITQVTDALNEMRARIRQLLDDRTHMLAAISHDLRTPLTRLRLRAERIKNDGLRTLMLRDLTKVGRMLDDTLEYLRDDTKSESLTRVDLPSLLQTICWDFSDIGHAVSYVGPERFTYACRPRALTRAVTNIVENASKHSSVVNVTLGVAADNAVRIEISDNGPGIPGDLLEKVFQPFFKVDNARSENKAGFGLGLSIALDIVKRHGGNIEMGPQEPVGLRVLMVLPAPTPLQPV
ncbi:ATP-binding protein [Bradyrhizobium liaoningense]|uniref:ATP-binding protein n=1 Tax=Bradyrhizobium liaoningense TaxID=43992 RepID=UPI001BAD8760|nr:ATP-binding protein [Bradyrhizobium liaoningense]MBR0706231.1 HAMP domain-containing protein [Bradyrhizobium liaoningense]